MIAVKLLVGTAFGPPARLIDPAGVWEHRAPEVGIMEYCKCAFAAPLVTGAFGCCQAEPVTRRGGPDVACRAAASSERCRELFERLKGAALPAFGVEDDLESMPHSVLVKIQHGGLLGLQRAIAGQPAERVDDIDRLVDQAIERYAAIAAVPCTELVEDMIGYRLRRRR